MYSTQDGPQGLGASGFGKHDAKRGALAEHAVHGAPRGRQRLRVQRRSSIRRACFEHDTALPHGVIAPLRASVPALAALASMAQAPSRSRSRSQSRSRSRTSTLHCSDVIVPVVPPLDAPTTTTTSVVATPLVLLRDGGGRQRQRGSGGGGIHQHVGVGRGKRTGGHERVHAHLDARFRQVRGHSGSATAATTTTTAAAATTTTTTTGASHDGVAAPQHRVQVLTRCSGAGVVHHTMSQVGEGAVDVCGALRGQVEDTEGDKTPNHGAGIRLGNEKGDTGAWRKQRARARATDVTGCTCTRTRTRVTTTLTITTTTVVTSAITITITIIVAVVATRTRVRPTRRKQGPIFRDHGGSGRGGCGGGCGCDRGWSRMRGRGSLQGHWVVEHRNGRKRKRRTGWRVQQHAHSTHVCTQAVTASNTATRTRTSASSSNSTRTGSPKPGVGRGRRHCRGTHTGSAAAACGASSHDTLVWLGTWLGTYGSAGAGAGADAGCSCACTCNMAPRAASQGHTALGSFLRPLARCTHGLRVGVPEVRARELCHRHHHPPPAKHRQRLG